MGEIKSIRPVTGAEKNEKCFQGNELLFALNAAKNCSYELLSEFLFPLLVFCRYFLLVVIKSLLTKLSWPGDGEKTFRYSSQATACLPHTVETSHCSFLSLNAKQESCKYQFLVFGLTRPGIEPESTVSVADALSTRPLIGFAYQYLLFGPISSLIKIYCHLV